MDSIENLRNIILNTYLQRFDELEPLHRFHFASRLYAWTGGSTYRDLLASIRKSKLPANHELRAAEIENTRQELIIKDYDHDIVNYARRKPFFDAYPDLLLLHYAIFKVRHWLVVYGVDERQLLSAVLPVDTTLVWLQRLATDNTALQTLSTYAINVLYVYERLYNTTLIHPELFREIGQQYDTNNPEDIELLIYLYTHCIICDTDFYTKQIPSSRVAIYTDMLGQLENIINVQFDNIHLDNKLEYLVCCKLLGVASPVEKRILDEAVASLDPTGSFLVDVHNNYPQKKRVTLTDSEHRNALFLMATVKPRYCATPVST